MKEASKEWLDRAYLDLKTVEYISPSYRDCCFPRTASSGKISQGVLEEKGLDVPKIHNLRTLYRRVIHLVDLEFPEEPFQILDSLYVESRYPVDVGLFLEGRPAIEDIQEL